MSGGDRNSPQARAAYEARWQAYQVLRDAGRLKTDAARELGMSASQADRFERAYRRSRGVEPQPRIPVNSMFHHNGYAIRSGGGR